MANSTDNQLLEECCKALGWQGGTIHQVIEEIKKLRKAYEEIDERQSNFIKLMDEAFDENIEEIKKELQDEGIDVKKIQKELLEFIKQKQKGE